MSRCFCICLKSVLPRCKLDQQVDIIGLNAGFVRGAATLFGTAFGAFVRDDISLFEVGLDEDGLHKTQALASAVAGVFVNMYRPQTEGAMVARGRTERFYLASAMTADEA